MNAVTDTHQLGKYRLEGVIGEGAMGVVYKGFDPDIERPVAIKVLHSHLLGDDFGEELAVRFRLEAKAAARCMHPHIVTVFDYGVSDDLHYIVMEYIEGIDLKSLLRQETRIPVKQASDTVLQVLSALEHAHMNGVIHRDIKPANIMMLENGHVKVADFGVARLASSDITQAGLMVGTPGYMSPEGRAGNRVDQRSDLYSLAVVFYESITGKHLKLEKPDIRTRQQELMEAIEDPETADMIHALLTSALQENPALRIASATEFANQLSTILSPELRHFPDKEELAATVMRTARRPIRDLRRQIQSTRGDATSTSAITASAIEQIEKEFLVYVGPMASRLVKKYASQSSNLDSLLDALSSHIPNQQEQTQFRSAVSASGLTHLTSPSQISLDPASQSRPETTPAIVLGEEQQQQISRLLAQYAGPLASRLVSRGQRNAASMSEFRQLLAESISNTAEQSDFLQQLDQLLQG